MTIIEALKQNSNLRITNGNKWLYFDEVEDVWAIRTQEYKKRTTDIILLTSNEEYAVKKLLEEEG